MAIDKPKGGTALRKAIKAAGARLWYLPPYSPDLNPIEQTFAKIKHWLRPAQKRSVEDTWRYVGDLVSTINPANAPTISPTQDTLPSIHEPL